jgi:hypothetical protein
MATPIQSQSTQPSTPNPTLQPIQIQLPAEMFRAPAPTSNVPGDITPTLMLIAFTILLKVTIDYLKPIK